MSGNPIKAIVTVYNMDNGVNSVVDDSTVYYFNSIEKAEAFKLKIDPLLDPELNRAEITLLSEADLEEVLEAYESFKEEYKLG